MRNKIFIVIILMLTWPGELQARDVYVRLANSSSYSVGISQGMLTMTDADGRLSNLGENAEILVNGAYVSIMGNNFPMPVRLSGSGLLQFKGRSYRGAFLITQRGGLLNVVDLELYLRGVLPAEVGADWHEQALRTQAICARTYVLKQSMNRADKGYDVVDTDADQVYKGAGVETPKTNHAVSSTAGEVLTYGKDLAFTYFHSDSGGHTADISDVWGRDNLPYLSGVPEIVNYESPVSVWNAKVSSEKIRSAVKKVTGTDIGTVNEVQVSEVDDGGRAITMNFIGSNGSKSMRASQFRLSVDPRTIKSTMFTPSGGAFKVNNTTTPSGLVTQRQSQGNSSLTFEEEQGIAKMTSEGIFTTTELIDMLSNPDKKKKYYQTGLSRGGNRPAQAVKPRSKYGYTIEKAGNDFIFYGRGWGHGVGMSQWGAMAMAEQGYTAEKILAHYYPGTSVRKIK